MCETKHHITFVHLISPQAKGMRHWLSHCWLWSNYTVYCIHIVLLYMLLYASTKLAVLISTGALIVSLQQVWTFLVCAGPWCSTWQVKPTALLHCLLENIQGPSGTYVSWCFIGTPTVHVQQLSCMDSHSWRAKVDFASYLESILSWKLWMLGIFNQLSLILLHMYVHMYILKINSLVMRNQLKVCTVPTSHLWLQCNPYPSQAVSGSLCFWHSP